MPKAGLTYVVNTRSSPFLSAIRSNDHRSYRFCCDQAIDGLGMRAVLEEESFLTYAVEDGDITKMIQFSAVKHGVFWGESR